MYFYHTNFKNVCCYGKSSDSNTSKRKGSREIYISIQRSTKVWNNHEQKTTMCEIWTHRKSTSAINLAFKQDWNTIYQVEYMHLFKINEEAHRPYSHLSIKDHEGPVIKAHICISQPPSLSLQNKTILNKDRLHYNHFTIAFSVLCISTCQQIDRINLTPPPPPSLFPKYYSGKQHLHHLYINHQFSFNTKISKDKDFKYHNYDTLFDHLVTRVT